MSIVATPLQLPRVIAHRGASFYAPENTLAALYKAHQLGIPWSECDATLTADDHVVILHDATVNRTTNGRGAVDDFSYQDLTALDAGSWFGAAFAGESIPTLQQYAERSLAYGMGLNVEIKPTLGKEIITAEKVLDVLHACWPRESANRLLVSSFSLPSLHMARMLNKNLWLGLLMDAWLEDWESILDHLECIAVHVRYPLLTEEKVRRIQAQGRLVLAYTVDTPAVAQKLFDWGVDAIFSNVPNLM